MPIRAVKQDHVVSVDLCIIDRRVELQNDHKTRIDTQYLQSFLLSHRELSNLGRNVLGVLLPIWEMCCSAGASPSSPGGWRCNLGKAEKVKIYFGRPEAWEVRIVLRLDSIRSMPYARCAWDNRRSVCRTISRIESSATASTSAWL